MSIFERGRIHWLVSVSRGQRIQQGTQVMNMESARRTRLAQGRPGSLRGSPGSAWNGGLPALVRYELPRLRRGDFRGKWVYRLMRPEKTGTN